MSSVVISGDTSGAITLAAPAVAGTNTINLPAAAGTLVLAGTTPSFNGIAFPATQSASADANTLDDYEEGTWSPTWTGSSTNPTVTYDVNRYGKYTKIGNVVYISARIGISTTTGGSGSAQIGGLPFTVSNDNAYPAMSLGYKTNFNTNGPDWARFNSNTSYATVYYDANTNETALTIANLQNGVDCLFTGFYYTS